MAIRKRTTNPEFKGNNPRLGLGTDRLMIYQWLKQFPGKTSVEIQEGVNIPRPQAMGRITELKNEGLIRPTGEKKPGARGRILDCYEIVEENSIGYARDEIQVRISYYRTPSGRYYVRANVVGAIGIDRDKAGVGHFIKKEVITRHMPMPKEPVSLQATANKSNSLITDADYEIIDK